VNSLKTTSKNDSRIKIGQIIFLGSFLFYFFNYRLSFSHVHPFHVKIFLELKVFIEIKKGGNNYKLIFIIDLTF